MIEGKRQAAFTMGAFFKDHDVILNTLDRENKGMFLPMAAFVDTVDDWEGVPVIKALDHPDMEQFNENPELALAKVKGKIVGKVKDPRIDMIGHPTLNSALALEDDVNTERQIVAGTLSLSTAFWHGGLKPDDKLPFPVVQGPVKPHHVLLFEEDPTINAVPGDKGSFIINKDTTEEVDPTAQDGDEEGLFTRFKTWLAKEKDEAATMQDAEAPAAANVEITGDAAPAAAPAAEPAAVPATAEAAVDAASVAVVEAIGAESFDPEAGKQLAEALITIEQLRAEIIKLKEGAAATEAEMKWESFKANMPPGMLHGEKEAELKTLYEGDPDKAWRLVMKIKTDPVVPGQEGQTFTAGGELESPKIGAYNPVTKAYEDAHTL